VTKRSLRARLLIAAALLIIVAIGSVVPAVAQPESQAAGAARFIDTSADADFPVEMTFNLEVESDTSINAAELYWRPADDPQLSAAYPEIDPGTTVDITYEVDLSTNYLPPGLDIVYFWRVIDADGAVSESPEATIWYMDESQDWETLTDGAVTFYWYDGSDDFAADVVETANRSIERLRDRFGVRGDEPIRIVAYGDSGDFADALPPNSAEWIGGQAYPGLNVIFSILEPGRGAKAETRRMIPHEVSHLLLEQATENPFNSPPNWLDEGLAVYNQETEDFRMDDLLDDAIDEGRLIPVRALNSSFPLDDQQALLSYAESWSIVTYIIEELGDSEMQELVAIFRDEVSYDEAVEGALGMSIEELDANWKAWLDYAGDQPVPQVDGDNQVDVDPSDDEELTSTEWWIATGIFGVGTLIALGFTIFAFLRWRNLGKSTEY
jgi:hypothetical protein